MTSNDIGCLPRRRRRCCYYSFWGRWPNSVVFGLKNVYARDDSRRKHPIFLFHSKWTFFFFFCHLSEHNGPWKRLSTVHLYARRSRSVMYEINITINMMEKWKNGKKYADRKPNFVVDCSNVDSHRNVRQILYEKKNTLKNLFRGQTFFSEGYNYYHMVLSNIIIIIITYRCINTKYRYNILFYNNIILTTLLGILGNVVSLEFFEFAIMSTCN